ncbi:MAG TPA: hypothetical protein VFR44_13085 [Actinomycetota bacterium]|nr:hypothetical protein [Actinomycetota bacterium]
MARRPSSTSPARAESGWPGLTISRGTVVARDGEPAQVEAGRGRFLPRRPYLAGS